MSAAVVIQVTDPDKACLKTYDHDITAAQLGEHNDKLLLRRLEAGIAL